jgi:hypothetical protein
MGHPTKGVGQSLDPSQRVSGWRLSAAVMVQRELDHEQQLLQAALKAAEAATLLGLPIPAAMTHVPRCLKVRAGRCATAHCVAAQRRRRQQRRPAPGPGARPAVMTDMWYRTRTPALFPLPIPVQAGPHCRLQAAHKTAQGQRLMCTLRRRLGTG